MNRKTEPLRPIRNDKNHAGALKEIERLWDAPEGSPEFERLEILSALVDAYEREHHAIDPPDPIEAIKFRVEQGDITRSDLARMLGGPSRVSEIMHRRRGLSASMIRNLHGAGIPAEVLIQNTMLSRAGTGIRHRPKAPGSKRQAVAQKTKKALSK